MEMERRFGLRLAVEDFVHHEARLLDERRYAEWEELWNDDGIYWVPVGNADYDPTERVSLIYDDRAALSRRIRRLCGDSAYAQIPPSTMVRVVSNVEVEETSDGGIDAHSSFILHSSRRNIRDVFAGRVHHALSTVDGSWRISRRTVVLVGGADPVPNLSFVV